MNQSGLRRGITRQLAPTASLAKHSITRTDGRSFVGLEVKRWRKWAVKEKGGKHCPTNAKTEINLAAFDLLRLLYLQAAIIQDGLRRGQIVSRKTNKLPRIHARYDQINWSFMRRVESLGLSKADGISPLDAMRNLG